MKAVTPTSGIAHPKFMRFRGSDGAVWNGSAFATYSAGSIASYGIAATEIGATGTYKATDPAPTTPGYALFISAAGSSLATSDLPDNVLFLDDPLGPVTVQVTVSNSKTFDELVEFIAAMVGGAKTSGAEAAGNQTYVVRTLDDTADLAEIQDDGIGNRSVVTW